MVVGTKPLSLLLLSDLQENNIRKDSINTASIRVSRWNSETGGGSRNKDWANEAPYSLCRFGRTEKLSGIEPLSMFPDRMLQSLSK